MIPITAKPQVQWYSNESPSIKVHFLHSSETQDTICISISLFKGTIDTKSEGNNMECQKP